MHFDGKVFIVTGGASGVGRATAGLLIEAGASVVIADVDTAAGETAVGELGDRAVFHATDLRSLDAIRELVAVTVERCGQIDGLANVAAVHMAGSADFLEMTPETWQLVDDVNHRAVFFLCQAVAQSMVKAGTGGAIVNVASGAAFRPVPRTSAYSGSKGGVVALTRTMAYELTPHKIRVNVVAPGHIASEPIRARMSQEQLDTVASTLVGGRWMDPVEVARAIFFLLGDRSRGMTGATVNVNLGNYMPH